MEENPSLLATDDAKTTTPTTTEPVTEPVVTDTKVEDKKVEGAPETYSDFTLPEGFEVDKEALDQFKPLAKELNLTQENAQKLVNMQASLSKKMAEANAKAFETMVNGWADTAKADKEFGGGKFDENLAIAKSALDKFGTPGLKQALNETGAGNHPEFIRLLWNVGKAMQSFGTVTGSGNPAPPTDPAKILFPNMK